MVMSSTQCLTFMTPSSADLSSTQFSEVFPMYRLIPIGKKEVSYKIYVKIPGKCHSSEVQPFRGTRRRIHKEHIMTKQIADARSKKICNRGTTMETISNKNCSLRLLEGGLKPVLLAHNLALISDILPTNKLMFGQRKDLLKTFKNSILATTVINIRKNRHSGSVVERPLCDREVAGSIPGRVIPKTLKMVLAALSLGAQH